MVMLVLLCYAAIAMSLFSPGATFLTCISLADDVDRRAFAALCVFLFVVFYF